MLENFHLAAIINQRIQKCLLKIPLDQALQDSLAVNWQSQYETFVEGIDEISFDPGYTPDAHERFYLPEFKLPDWLSEENSLTVPTLDSIGSDDELINSIKGIIAFARINHWQELMLFQNFKPSQVIRPGWSLILERDTYNSLKRPGLTLARKLSAIYQRKERKLVFDNFRNVNTFLPLSDFYKEASDKEIVEVLNHELFVCEDKKALVTGANQWYRKRFAMLKDSGVLDRFSAVEIQSRSSDYQVTIQLTNNGKNIAFPTDKAEAKKLLQFLNEERFLGPVTGTLFETNSKKQVD